MTDLVLSLLLALLLVIQWVCFGFGLYKEKPQKKQEREVSYIER